MDEPDPAPSQPAGPRGRAQRLALALEGFATNNAFLRALRSMRELVALVLWLLFGVLPTGKTVLDVRYRFVNLEPPAAARPFLDSMQRLEPASAAHVAASTLMSPQLLRIELRNRTRSPISHVDLTIRGALAVAAVAATSDSRLDPAATDYQLHERIISFPHLREIAPQASVAVLVWGQFAPPLLVLQTPVDVSSDAVHVDISEEEDVSGVGLFVAEHMTWLTILLATGLLLLGLRRLGRR